jgi:hypothetical protein
VNDRCRGALPICLNHIDDVSSGLSVAVIQADAALSDHWALVAEAINAIWAFSRDHDHRSEDELTLQLFGIRLFNAAGASIKLAMASYYQSAFGQVRDVIETSFLKAYPEEIDDWRRADRKKRISHFGPGRIRTVLDKRDGYTSGERKKIYDLISEYATHPSYPGVTMTTTGAANIAQVGPFFDEKKLRSWLGEVALRLSPAGLVLLPHPDGSDTRLLITTAYYLQVVNSWWSKYRGVKPQAASPVSTQS